MATTSVQVPVRRYRVVGLAVLVLAMILGATQLPGLAQSAGDEPLPTVVFVARADNPVDALGAGAVAGTMGAQVLLTRSSVLEEQTRAALVALDPDLVVLAGGTAALSPAVEQAIEAIPLPTRRIAGATRVDTAALLSELAAELGFGRPLLTDTTVAGDVGLSGTLSVDALEVDSVEQVDNLNASLLEGLSASDFLQPGDAIDATTLEGNAASDFAVADLGFRHVDADPVGVPSGETVDLASVELDLADHCGDGTTEHGFIAVSATTPRLTAEGEAVVLARIVLDDEQPEFGSPGTHVAKLTRRAGDSFFGFTPVSTQRLLVAEPGSHDVSLRMQALGLALDVPMASLTLIELGWTCGGGGFATAESARGSAVAPLEGAVGD